MIQSWFIFCPLDKSAAPIQISSNPKVAIEIHIPPDRGHIGPGVNWAQQVVISRALQIFAGYERFKTKVAEILRRLVIISVEYEINIMDCKNL